MIDKRAILRDLGPEIVAAAKPHTGRGLAETAATLALIAAVVAGTAWAVGAGYPPAWAVGWFLIGALQHRLSILQHEAVHRQLFAIRWLNEALGLYVVGLSIGAFPMGGRRAHLSHHAFLGTDRDGDRYAYVDPPKTRTALAWWMAAKLLGFEALRRMATLAFRTLRAPSAARPESQVIRPRPDEWLALLSVQAGIAAMFALTVGAVYYVLLWVVPLFTSARFLMGLRGLAEHAVLAPGRDAEERHLRSIYNGPFERFFLSPIAFNFHAEHHLFPGIPTWRLPRIGPLISAHPAFSSQVRIYSSYFACLQELLSPRVSQPVVNGGQGSIRSTEK